MTVVSGRFGFPQPSRLWLRWGRLISFKGAVQTPPLKHLHAEFLAMVPRIEQHGQVYFRNVKCATTKEEYIAEMMRPAEEATRPRVSVAARTALGCSEMTPR